MQRNGYIMASREVYALAHRTTERDGASLVQPRLRSLRAVLVAHAALARLALLVPLGSQAVEQAIEMLLRARSGGSGG